MPELSPPDATSAKPLGSFAFVLHSHIPYVLAHGQWPHGTDWLTEVAAESYIPLLDALHELIAEGLSPKLTLGMTPILCEQLSDAAFKDEFTDWLEANLGAAASDARQFRAEGNTEKLALATHWRQTFRHVLNQFENVYERDIVGAFRALQDAGHIEIITSAATHGYLPLLLTDNAVRAQVKAGVASYEHHFGCRPRGFWMPECAYRPRYRWQSPLPTFETPEPAMRRGVDEFLSDEKIAYTFVDGHLIRGGETQGVYADRFGALKALWHQFTEEHTPETGDREEYKPYFIASSGEESQTPVAVFSRDLRSSHAVWAADSGYPGDEWYLEFHKKQEPGRLRYWRVSPNKADLDAKQPYQPEKAEESIAIQATHFVREMKLLLREQTTESDELPIVTAMYDTELFGHWWHEGPRWLKAVLRQMATDPEFNLTTCETHLSAIPPEEARSRIVALPEGSWGEGGFHWIWLNADTVWMWELIYDAETQMTELAQYAGNPAVTRPLQQVARELLLLEASDWPFVTSTTGAPDYAEARVKAHHMNFGLFAQMVRDLANGEEVGPSPWHVLGEVETRDNPFANVDPVWWAVDK